MAYVLFSSGFRFVHHLSEYRRVESRKFAALALPNALGGRGFCVCLHVCAVVCGLGVRRRACLCVVCVGGGASPGVLPVLPTNHDF